MPETHNTDYQLLKNAVMTQGRVIGDDILKVDSFLNHQLDISLLHSIGRLFHRYFKDRPIDKIMTAEVSGIAIATVAAHYFKVPVVFAKKTLSKNLDPDTYEGRVYSFTKDQTYQIRIARRYLQTDERILILDDFLANGEAMKGMKEIIDSAGAVLAGAGVVIEKSFQPGAEILKERGIQVYSLIQIDSLAHQRIIIRE